MSFKSRAEIIATVKHFLITRAMRSDYSRVDEGFRFLINGTRRSRWLDALQDKNRGGTARGYNQDSLFIYSTNKRIPKKIHVNKLD